MPQNKQLTYQQASLSQKVSNLIPILQKLSGSDPETSLSIATLLKLGELGYINLNDPAWVLTMGILDAKRLALFATSEKNNEITKMGLMMPKAEALITDYNEEG